MENREKILEQGTKYANENWNVHENPNEYDNAHDDFIAGALWAVKNSSIPDVVEQGEQLVCGFCTSTQNVEEIPTCDNCWDRLNNH